MRIEGIQPDSNNEFRYIYQYKKLKNMRVQKKQQALQPIDALIVDEHNSKTSKEKNHDTVVMLTSYINALSDDDVNGRIKEFNHSFEHLDDAIVEKMIMESL
jgi:hypothetical protein